MTLFVRLSAATTLSLNSHKASGVARSLCSNIESRASRSKLLSPFFCRRAAAGLIASLAYPALHSATATTTVALCDSDSEDGGSDDKDFISKIRSKLENESFFDIGNSDALDSAMQSVGGQISLAVASGIPTDLSYGFFAGYFSGLALKKVGRLASITLGVSFLALQTLAYHGYIDVHHDKLQKEVETLFDRNNDGVVDSEDLKSMLQDVTKVAGFRVEDQNLVASGGGFGMGFLGGLRSG